MYLGVVARALPRGFELHDRPARLRGQKCNKTDQLSGMAGVCDVGGPRIESRQATFFWLFV